MDILNKDGKIFIDGEFDIYNAHEARTKILEAYENNKSDIVLDFSGVSFMDSTGLGILISIQKIMEEEGHKIKIVNVDNKIKKIFVITELDKVFGVE